MTHRSTDILAIAAHPDDIELHVSGALLKTIDDGGSVAICDLTRGERGSRGSAEVRTRETETANRVLGIDSTMRWNLGIPDGDIRITDENLARVVEVIRYFRPKVLLLPSADDRHPDHYNAHQLVREAWFNAGLSAVTSSHDNQPQAPHRTERLFMFDHSWESMPDFIIDISHQFDRKLRAIASYSSQFLVPGINDADQIEGPETFISTESFMDAMIARMKGYGFMIGARYGEGYHRLGTPLKVRELRDLV